MQNLLVVDTSSSRSVLAVKTEEKFLYEASRGNANPDINTKGLE